MCEWASNRKAVVEEFLDVPQVLLRGVRSFDSVCTLASESTGFTQDDKGKK